MVQRMMALSPDTVVGQYARLCLERDISVIDAAQTFGVSRTAVYNWLNGFASPHADTLAKMAEIIEQSGKQQA